MRSSLLRLFAAGVIVWTAALAAAAVGVRGPAPAGWRLAAAAAVYAAAGVVCHQQPARSFRLGGSQLPVCARCAGLYGGALAGLLALAWPIRGRAVRTWLTAAAVPTGATLIVETAGLVDPGNLVRAAAAVPAGAAVARVVAGAIRGEIH